MGLRNLFKSFALLGASSLIGTAVALVRNKFLAVLLGPVGVGLFAQLFGFQMLTAGLAPMGMQIGVLRHLAKHRDEDYTVLARLVRTSSRLFVVLSLLTMALCLLGARPLAGWALDSADLAPFLIAPVLGVPLLVQTQFWQTFLQAGLDVKAYSKSLVIPSVLGIVAVVPLVLLWGQAGASVHLLVFPLIGYVVARVLAVRTMAPELKQSLRTAPFDPAAVRELSYFALANLPVFALTLVLPFLVRAQLIRDVGLEGNGIFQAVFAISTQFLGIPISAIGAYSFPKISKLQTHEEMNEEVNHTVRAVLLFSTVGILGLLVFRDVVVRLLFTAKFLPATGLFAAQMIGDVFRVVTWAIQLPLLPLERFRARTILTTLQFVTALGVFYAFPASMRLEGAVWSHAASWCAFYVAHHWYLRRLTGFRLTRGNAVLLANSVGATAIVAFLPFESVGQRAVGVAIGLAWALFSISRAEFQAALSTVRSRAGLGAPTP